MKKAILILSVLSSFFNSFSQYNPAAGKLGSSAIYKDSSIFVNWATQCKIIRGWKDIAQKDSGFTSIGDSISPTGKAGENGIVSIGDSGIAICSFQNPLINGEGWDFAVFENSFDDNYLEFAFVEVSSDGNRFFRFPCHSLSDTNVQTSSFGTTNPEKINNLAGKYRFGYGTPFDIDELPDYKDLDKQKIRYVKIVDVVGTLNKKYASFDTAFRKINDPYPTPFASGGFDLDAIGVINEKSKSEIFSNEDKIKIYAQNPLSENCNIEITLTNTENLKVLIFDCKGSIYKDFSFSEKSFVINSSDIPQGFFIIKLIGKNINYTHKSLKL